MVTRKRVEVEKGGGVGNVKSISHRERIIVKSVEGIDIHSPFAILDLQCPLGPSISLTCVPSILFLNPEHKFCLRLDLGSPICMF